MGEREVITPAAEPAYRSDGEVGEIGTAPERFPGVDVGQMYFDEWNRDPRQRIAKCDARMGVRGRIEHDERNSLYLGLLNPIDQIALEVALVANDASPGRAPGRAKACVDVRQRLPPVDRGLARTEEVQVRAVEHKDRTFAVF